MNRLFKTLIIFLSFFAFLHVAKASTLPDSSPILSDEVEINPIYQDKVNLEVILPSLSYEVTLKYDTDKFIWADNCGLVTLEVAKEHDVILMDLEGNIIVYTLIPTLGKAKINNVIITDVDFNFNKNIFNYEIDVPYNMSVFNPIIEVDSNVNYSIDVVNLRVGKNIVKVNVTADSLDSSVYIFVVNRGFSATAGLQEKTFEYKGNYDIFVAPATGDYTLEVWGAQGGGYHQNGQVGTAGLGGYAKGTVRLNKGDKLYVYVGGKGITKYGSVNDIALGGYNGGGNGITYTGDYSDVAASGGGATDIRLVPGAWDNINSLNSRIIVAGGGGAGGMDVEPAGDGGGEVGSPNKSSNGGIGAGGTQTSGWAFGKGFSAGDNNSCAHISCRYGGQGAGGGWYGGYYTANSNGWAGAGGGSGFVWSEASKDNVPSDYLVSANYYLTNTSLLGGNVNIPKRDNSGVMKGNTGDGFAKISYHLSDELDSLENISVDKGTLVPEFKESQKEYSLVLDEEDKQITISGNTLKGEGLITGLGTYEIMPGEENILVSFTNLDGKVTVYTIHVSRPASSDATIKGFYVNGKLYEVNDPDVREFNIEIPTEVEKINLDIIKSYPDQKFNLVESGTQQEFDTSIIFDFLETEISKDIISISEKELANLPYKFNFSRKKSSELKELNITGGTLIPSFKSDVYEYTLDIVDFAREVPMEAIPYFLDATVTIDENRYVGVNDKTIKVSVHLDGVADTVYTLNINRVPALLDPVNQEYTCINDYQTFTAPAAALYTLELWGAQGGGYHQNHQVGNGGKGGYARGSVYLNAGEKLYVYVGCKGVTKYGRAKDIALGGYNGGGNGITYTGGYSDVAASGGGATDIRLVPGAWDNNSSLLSRIIVAGGGGAGGMDIEPAGDGGGEVGSPNKSSNGGIGAGGTQTSGWAFGKGFSAGDNNSCAHISCRYGGQGAGGGWYGGYYTANSNGWAGAGGGSGFALTTKSAKNVPVGYSVDAKYYLTDTELIGGNQKMPTYDSTNLMSGNTGDGYAKITATPGIVGDTFLDNIIVDGGALDINFEPWVYEYSIDVDKNKSKINFEAIAKNSEAKIMGNGDVTLNPGENVHKIVVSTDDGASKVYTIKINKELSDDAEPINILFKNAQNYLCGLSTTYCKYNFDAKVSGYEILLPFATENVAFEAILKTNSQSVKYYLVEHNDNNQEVRTEVSEASFVLSNNVTIIDVDVTSEDKNNTITYRYNLRKDDAGNNNLASLEVMDPSIDIGFQNNIYEYYFEVPYTYESITLNVVPENPDATYEVVGNENLKQGLNEIKVVVSAPNGLQKSYLLHVYRKDSENNFLSSLTVSKQGENVELTPVFSKLINEYTATVASDTKTITIEATAEDTNATISNLGTFDLNPGNNEFNVTVLASNGVANIYKINIIKAKNSNSKLASLSVEGYGLSPEFNKDILLYNITIPNGVNVLDVIAVPEESTSTYTIRGNSSLYSKVNNIVVTVVAEDKSYTVYEIVANKEASTNNYLKEINVVNGVLNEEFNKELLEYTIDVDGSVNDITLTGIRESETATVIGNGTYALVPGENNFELKVISESGEEKIYKIKVNKELNDDVRLKEVTNSLGSVVLENKDETKPYDYLINVQYELNKIDINGIANSNTSVVSGGGTFSLTPGDNDIVLRVTAQNNDYKDYVVRVVRDKSNNDDLEFLWVEEGGLSPHFSETILEYDVKIPNEKTEVHIEAIPEDKDAQVSINGDTTNLEVGVVRRIEVVVVAPSGATKVYALLVTRQESTAENLALLKLETNRGDLVPTFNPNTLNYELTVEHEISDITVSAEAMSEEATIEGVGTYNLKVGKNAISVFVVGKSGVQKDYQIVVTRKVSNDARLETLVIKSHVMNPNFDKDTQEYSINTALDRLEFTAIKPVEAESTFQVIGNDNFASGENIVTIRVTAPDKTTIKDYVLKVNKDLSKNNNLASLEVVGQTLKPIFHKGVTFYSVNVPKSMNSVVINASAEDSRAVIDGTGLKTLQTGENYFDVEVTSEALTKKVYKVLIIKEASDNNNLLDLIVSEGTLDPLFNKDVLDYKVLVDSSVEEITISGIFEDSNATSASFGTYSLDYQDNNIPIAVMSESGIVKVYNVLVYREPIVSAELKSLNVDGYELDPDFKSELTEYFAEVNNEITSLNISYETIDPNATVIVSGNQNFEEGINEVYIDVTASDNVTTKRYVIYVNRLMSSNNYLNSLIVENYTLTPVFDPLIMEYSVEVPRDVEFVNVSATVQDASSTITSGVGRHDLSIGNNKIEVKVRSSIGVTRVYKINVNRLADNKNKLNDIIVTSLGNLLTYTPEFNKDINEYNMTVSSDTNFINIKAIEESEYETISGAGTKEVNTGLNEFKIIVMAEDGTVNNYVLKVTKEVSNNNYLLDIIPSAGVLAPDFDKEVLEYSLNLDFEQEDLGFDVIKESNMASVTGTEKTLVSEGSSVREIVVTAEDGSIRTYKINVNRATASNALLDNLEVEHYPFEFDSNTFTYTIRTSVSKKKLLESEITATPKDENATVNMMGDLDLTPGIVNIYTIEVIAKDSYTTQEYILNIIPDETSEYSLKSKVYDINRNNEEDYVIGIMPSTNIDDFKLNFDNETDMLHVYMNDEETSGLTATAMEIRLEKDGFVYDKLRVIVRGDLTSDGRVNVTDQVKLINYVGKVGTLDKYQMLAADLTFDGRVNVTDQVKLINYVGKVITNQDLNPKKEEEGS